MPRGKRSSTPKHGDQNKKSKAKNNSTESKSPLAERQEDSPPSELPVTSKIPVMPEVPVTPKTEDSQQGKEEESEKVINSEEQREKPDVEGKMDNQGTEGQKKRKNKKKNKQQNDEIGEVEKQVEDINKLDKPSERLWNKIEQHVKGCPEPLVKFFDDLVHGNHWTFLRDRKIEDIKQVLEICKNSHCSSSQRSKEETKENKQEQPSNKRERSARKGVDKTRTENQEELKKNETAELKPRVAGLTEEVAELRRSLEVKEQEVKRFEAEKSHLQQDKEKIYHQLRRRDEDFLHIQNEYHKVEQNVRALNIKIRDEQDRYLKLDEANKEIAKERDEFKDRFSKLAGAKLTAGNARIQDLSDINRPQKLGEKYSELYDNEWTDALEEIQENEDLNEKEAVTKLLDLFKSCVSFCQMRAEEQEMRFMSAVRQAVDLNVGGAMCNGSGEGPEQESDLHILSPSDSKMLKDFLKAKGGTTLTYLQRVFQTEYPTYAESGPKVQEFLNQSIEVCWFSAIQDPPLAFDWNFPEGSEMIDKYVKVFTKSGSKIDFVVWPVMKLHVDGDVLCKGVIQPIPEGKTKKKKKDSES